MTHQGSYNELLKIENDIQRMRANSPGLSFLLGPKIQSFYSKNAMRLKVAGKKLEELKEAHIEKDENGKFKTKKDEASGGVMLWVFKSEEDEKAYQAAFEEHMSKHCEIHL